MTPTGGQAVWVAALPPGAVARHPFKPGQSGTTLRPPGANLAHRLLLPCRTE